MNSQNISLKKRLKAKSKFLVNFEQKERRNNIVGVLLSTLGEIKCTKFI